MRITYIDEAGRSNASHDPFLVVAGVVVDPDRQWAVLDSFYHDLTWQLFEDDAPDTDFGKPFIFHAKDLWHGSGNFPRNRWPLQTRMKIFEQLSLVPARFNVPIIYAAIDRSSPAQGLTAQLPPVQAAYIDAFFETVRSLEGYMREKAHGEVSVILAEETDSIKSAIELLHACYVDRRGRSQYAYDTFQSSHIVEQVAFVKKYNSNLLQMADHCAFIIKRQLQSCPHVAKYYENIHPLIWEKRAPGTDIRIRIPISELKVPQGDKPPS